MAVTRTFTIEAADGLKLSVLLTVPNGAGDGPWPLVVNPHGGPHARDRWEYDGEAQLLASRGIAVLKVDFRGSSGYGRAFETSGYGQWGRAMQDDVTTATRWAIESGYADAGRICIYGGSYGAYAALMGVIREPELYRCAVGAYGVYDLEVVKEWGDSNDTRWGRNFLERAIGGDRKVLAQYSPARQAARIKVPLLLAHGGRDRRAAPEHYRVLTRALDEAGARYETYFRSDEGHGLYNEKHAVEFAERLVSFLERNLGPR